MSRIVFPFVEIDYHDNSIETASAGIFLLNGDYFVEQLKLLIANIISLDIESIIYCIFPLFI